MIRVLVADNSRIHTRLLVDALVRDPLLEVIPYESDSSGLVAAAIAENIDVLLVSSNLDDQPARGLEILRELRALRPHLRALLLSHSSKDEFVLQAFRAGARGVFGVNEPVEMLSRCVRCVRQGQIWASSKALGVVMEALAASPAVRAVNANGMNLLSERELQVVRCLAEGLTNREIAERLKLSQHTIKNHLFRVFDKLGVSSRVELLFMTLSQSNNFEESLLTEASTRTFEGDHDETTVSILEREAQKGSPAAQLALAQAYLARRSRPEDLVYAYMWYLVASEHTSQAQFLLTGMLSAKQMEEAQEKASIWRASLKQTPVVAAHKPVARSVPLKPAI